MKTIRLTTAALAASLAAPAMLSAQEDRPYTSYVNFGFCMAQGHAHDMTQKTFGGIGAFNAEFGVKFRMPSASGMYFRPNFGVAKILAGTPDKEAPNYNVDGFGWRDGKVYDLMGIYVGLDFVYDRVFSTPVSFSTGPSFHTWNVDEAHAFGSPNQGSKGLKLGWRLGADYKINDQFKVNLAYTLTEWRTIHYSITTAYLEGFNPSRPAYFTISGSYIF